MSSKSSTGHDRCGRSQFSDGFTSAWLLILISTASVHEGVAFYFISLKRPRRGNGQQGLDLDLKGHWGNFLNLYHTIVIVDRVGIGMDRVVDRDRVQLLAF